MEDNQLVTAKVASEALAITTDLPENKLITYGELLEMIPSHDFGVELVEEFSEMIDFWNDGNANILFLIGTQSTKSMHITYNEETKTCDAPGGVFFRSTSTSYYWEFEFLKTEQNGESLNSASYAIFGLNLGSSNNAYAESGTCDVNAGVGSYKLLRVNNPNYYSGGKEVILIEYF